MVIDSSRGRIRVMDFSLVETGLGTMLEPTNLHPLNRSNQLLAAEGNLDDDDFMCLVDDILFIDGREKFQVQNPMYYGQPANWKCVNDLQLFQRVLGHAQFGKHHTGPAG